MSPLTEYVAFTMVLFMRYPFSTTLPLTVISVFLANGLPLSSDNRLNVATVLLLDNTPVAERLSIRPVPLSAMGAVSNL